MSVKGPAKIFWVFPEQKTRKRRRKTTLKKEGNEEYHRPFEGGVLKTVFESKPEQAIRQHKQGKRVEFKKKKGKRGQKRKKSWCVINKGNEGKSGKKFFFLPNEIWKKRRAGRNSQRKGGKGGGNRSKETFLEGRRQPGAREGVGIGP